jgi:hypothetical protein
MEKSYIRLNAVCKQFIYKVGIEFNSRLANLANSLGEYTAPVDGEAISVNSERFHKLYVFLVAVIVVASHVGGLTVSDSAGLVGKDVPNVKSLAVLIISAFDLYLRGCDTPYEIFFVTHIKTLQ